MTWLLTLLSGVGRKIWGYVAILAAAGAVLATAYFRGRKAEQTVRLEESAENLRTRSAVDENVRRLDDRRVRSELSDWVLDDER